MTVLPQKTVELILQHMSFKIFIAIIFFVLLGMGVKGVTIIKYGNELSDGINFDSPTHDALLQRHKYFGKYTTPVHIIFKDYLNYADPLVQKSIEGILNNFTSYKHIAEPDLEMVWLKHYKLFQTIPFGKMMLRPFNMSDERDFVYALKHIFLKYPPTRPYADDICFNEDYTRITSSRFILLMKDINDPKTEVSAIEDLYELASKSPIPIEIFGMMFHILESSLSVPASIAKIAAICCCLICLIFILFAPNIPYGLCISAVVLCSVVEVIGIVSFWNVKLEYVTLTTFSFSIGLCINYPSHMTFSIFIGRQKYSNDRRREAFYNLAYPIAQGCLSTVLGLVSLALHSHYVSQSAFKILFVISFLSAFHGLFSIPVALGVFRKNSKTPSGQSSNVIMTSHCERNLLTGDDNENK